MNRRLRAKIFNAVIAGVTGTLVLLFLINYSDTGAPPSLDQDTKKVKHPSFFLHNAHSIQFDELGQVDFSMHSEKAIHNPQNNSAKLTSPHIELYRDGTLNWIVDAQLGVISAKGDKVNLRQRVVVSSHDQQTTLKTPQLIIFPDKKLAKTDKPVTLQNPNGFTRSIGLVANMNDKRIDLLKQVRSQYQGVLFEDEP